MTWKFNILFYYWIVGCLVVGAGAAGRMNRCPLDPADSVGGHVEQVMIWPATIGIALVWDRNPKAMPCKVAP